MSAFHPAALPDDIGAHAVEYALGNWPVFPLNGKVPAIGNPHPKGSPKRQTCKGECGRHGHGMIDATTDIATVTAWWAGRYRGANIGIRVPDPMIVIDIDPRHGGLDSLAALRAAGELPYTLTTISGRGDGGMHLFFRRPSGKLSAKRLGPGIDLKTSLGYVVAAPSIHPDTGKAYTRIDRPIATPPGWLVAMLRHEPAQTTSATGNLRAVHYTGRSVADQFSATTSWADILEPHGWTCDDPDPDADGAVWLHPTATSACSATIRNGCLFVYSTNTPFDATEQGFPHGYKRFRAYALLNHGGDMSAAARELKARVG